MGVPASETAAKLVRIRVWLGSELLAAHRARHDRATRYLAYIRQEYPGVAVEIDNKPAENDADLPSYGLWRLTLL